MRKQNETVKIYVTSEPCNDLERMVKMKKYRVDTPTWSSQEFDDLNKALAKYETTKDIQMSEGVDEDSYVELVCSKHNFEDYKVLKRAMPVVDEDRMSKGLPRDEGYDFDYWAKWEELIHGAVELEMKR